MASQFFQRIAQWLANELITKRLANSSTFMKAAHKTHQTVTKSHKHAEVFAKKAPKLADKHAKDAHNFFSDFFSHFRDEIGKGARK